jgi:hypothetical protein
LPFYPYTVEIAIRHQLGLCASTIDKNKIANNNKSKAFKASDQVVVHGGFKMVNINAEAPATK